MKQIDIKNAIFSRLRAGKPAPVELPDVPMFTFGGDPVESFISKLESFDGKAMRFASRDEAVAWLMSQPEMDPEKKNIFSSAQGVPGNVGEKELTDLHNAHIVDTCVTESGMGVGETGSVWVTDRSLGHPACALLSRNLFILLDSKRIEGGLHQAYARLSLADHHYGSFFTGPSATADIEAVHITGAQGPLSMTVLLY